MPTMTKSALDLAKMALSIGKAGLSPYSTKFSRQDFIQAQHFAMLALRQFFQADYRKTTQMISEWSELRQALELEKVPHWTTLEKAHKRLLKKGVSMDFSTLSSFEPSAAA
jgi:hypothetical protein